ncbi:MAG: hypothetical protein ACQKBU_04000 [Verrucomicrobiales bacterium]
MIRLLFMLSLALTLCHAADEAHHDDLLRLSDGELSGSFGGVSPRGNILWNRDDGIDTLEFKPDKIRQIVLRTSGSIAASQETSHVTLINGDRLPAKILAMDEEGLTLDLPFGEQTVVPRTMVRSIDPNPFGGRLLYAGPFSEEGWEIISPGNEEEDPESAESDEEVPKEEGWKHVGGKWYFTGGHDVIRRDMGLTSKSTIRFRYDWRSRPPISIALYADFADPVEADAEAASDEAAEEEGLGAQVGGRLGAAVQMNRNRLRGSSSRSELSSYFGNAYVLSLRSSYAQLIRCGYDGEGNAFTDQISPSSSSVRFDDTGSAEFEIRTDLEAETLALYVNGSFAMQWQLKDEPLHSDPEIAPGTGLGFSMMGTDKPIRISDIIVAEWNGMPDSARSLQSDQFDVIVLTNGTDRFAGKVTKIQDNTLSICGHYAELEIPLEEIAKVEFSTPKDEATADLFRPDELTIYFQPLGMLSGQVLGGGRNELRFNSSVIGPLDVDLESAVLLEFQPGNGFLNYWDDDL